MPVALDAEFDLTASWAPESLDDAVLGHLHAGYGRIVDRNDAVSGLYAGIGTGPSGDNVQHDDRIGQHVECHSDPVELSIVYFIGLQYFCFCQVRGVRVEFVDNQRYGIFDQRVYRYGVDIGSVDERQKHVDLVVVPCDEALIRHVPGPVVAENLPSEQDAQSDGTCDYGGQYDGKFAVFIHGIKF